MTPEERRQLRFLQTLGKRIDAFQRYVAKRVAEKFREEVLKNAPSEQEMPDYAENIGVYRREDENARFAVALLEYEEPIPTDKSVIIYFESIQKTKAIIDTLMSPFYPFTINSLPVMPDRKVIRVKYTEVSQDEQKKVYQKNQADWPEISSILRKVGVNPRPLGESPEDFGAFENLVDKVIEMEKTDRPHWSKAVEKAKSGAISRRIKKDEIVEKIMNPSYGGYSRLGMIKKTYTKEDELGLEEFQKKLLKG